MRRLFPVLPLLVGLLLLLGGASARAASGPKNTCAPYTTAPCLMPFPDDRLAVRDSRTPTGRRVHIPASAMPVNASGVRWNPAELNRNDGFSPGSDIVVRLPGLNTQGALDRSRLVPLRDVARAFDRNQGVVLIDEATGRRKLIWAELDVQPPKAVDRNVLIHPGTSLEEGHTYVVALRGLRTAGGSRIGAPTWFAKLRKGGRLPKALKGQAARYARIFKVLKKAKISRGSLTLAWDFTVASRRSLVSRMLSMRNDAFAQLGDTNLSDGSAVGFVPKYTIDKVTEPTPAENPDLLRIVEGTLAVPCYLSSPGCAPGGRFTYATKGPDSRPEQRGGNVAKAPFICVIPRAAVAAPSRIALYGHGLLGTPNEVKAGNVQDMAQEHDFTFCATPWSGMSAEDVPQAAKVLSDLNLFPTIADREQQGFLNALFLGRAMTHAYGFTASPAFRLGGKSLIQPGTLGYDGNSQGGILGGALTAVAPDYTRAVLGVGGANFGGLLVKRSVDFAKYETVLNAAYPDQGMRQVILDLMQMGWDRGEGDGYAAHMTDHPLVDTPPHRVLLQIALGDHQVSPYAAEVLARTIGARAHLPVADPGRMLEKTAFYGIPSLPSGPYRGSAIVMWDSGPGVTPPAPLAPIPPSVGTDPHEHPRATPAAREQKSTFLRTGEVVDVCAGKPCHTSAFLP